MTKIEITGTGYANIEDISNFEQSRKSYIKGTLASKKLPIDSQLLLQASLLAIEQSGLVLKNINKNKIGIVVQTMSAGMSSYEQFMESVLANHPEPASFSCSLPCVPTANLSLCWGIAGPSLTLVCNDIYNPNLMTTAMQLILNDTCDYVFVAVLNMKSKTVQYLERETLVLFPEPFAKVLIIERENPAVKGSTKSLCTIQHGIDSENKLISLFKDGFPKDDICH